MALTEVGYPQAASNRVDPEQLRDWLVRSNQELLSSLEEAGHNLTGLTVMIVVQSNGSPGPETTETFVY